VSLFVLVVGDKVPSLTMSAGCLSGRSPALADPLPHDPTTVEVPFLSDTIHYEYD